jgi:hypothetical protein
VTSGPERDVAAIPELRVTLTRRPPYIEHEHVVCEVRHHKRNLRIVFAHNPEKRILKVSPRDKRVGITVHDQQM